MGAAFQLGRSDAVAWLHTLPSSSVDLLVTDPPYESLEKHRAIGTTTRLKHSKASSNDWFDIFPNDRFPELFAEVFRVLRKNAHFYLYCDPETMFVAKPLAEAAGFRFWKPLIWDKCLGPETPVWTDRGVLKIADVRAGDRVALPEGGFAAVKATRTTRAPALRLSFSDGTEVVASEDHRFVAADGTLVEARELRMGEKLCQRPVRERLSGRIELDQLIPPAEAVYELPETRDCLWCGQPFRSARAAAAHQARFCPGGRSKKSMAAELGISPKRLRRWLGDRRIPFEWARALGLEQRLTGRVRCYLQNDSEIWYPPSLPLDHALGRVVGLYAAEGYAASSGVSFAFHAEEKHLHAAIARFARGLGTTARIRFDGNRCSVDVSFRIARFLMQHFVGGTGAVSKYLTSAVYAAPEEFRAGVLLGLLEGDGHWSHDEQRETLGVASLDLAMFARRQAEAQGYQTTIRRAENDHAGAWRVRFDPIVKSSGLTVTSIERLGLEDLVDISVDHPDELFLLGNGAVTHNCRIGMGYHYRSRYECVLFFEKGKRKLNDLGIADVIQVPRVHAGYPAEKPVEVAEVLIRQSSQPGEIVVDPFMGSGSAGVAAVRNGRVFLGNDLCEEAVMIARRRLREAGAEEGEVRSSIISAPPLPLSL